MDRVHAACSFHTSPGDSGQRLAGPDRDGQTLDSSVDRLAGHRCANCGGQTVTPLRTV